MSITRSPSRLCDFVQGTKVGFLIDINSEKMAASIRAVMFNFLTCFKLLTIPNIPFQCSCLILCLP
ncbi:type IV secretion system DNA-binding domain-containing protein [Candidatus Protochlamydia sp. R18]|uniref:type IV secretion system DNA-binding domain-containing protein n=1 Tax=Candidatus Protochlamydia sp. R18 TaxID=1353977 RepID=UPI0011DCBF7F